MKILTSVVLIFAFAGISPGQQVTNKDIKKFCKGFITAVNKHDLSACLNYFDNDYRVAQHDKFLGGNTKQFVEEFLAGYSEKLAPDGNMYVPDFDNIGNIELTAIDFAGENECYVVFRITLKSENYFEAGVMIHYYSKKKMGFVGAMG